MKKNIPNGASKTKKTLAGTWQLQKQGKKIK